MLKTVDFVVLINTSHPLIKDQFELALQRAEDLLKERKNFQITASIISPTSTFNVSNSTVCHNFLKPAVVTATWSLTQQ